VAKGETVPYTITVTNPSASPMRVNGLTDVLPTGLAVVVVALPSLVRTANAMRPPSNGRAPAGAVTIGALALTATVYCGSGPGVAVRRG